MTETRSIGEILRDAADGRLSRALADNREPYDFVGTADRLFDLLEARKIDYVLVGGLAMLQYAEGRNTLDVDLIVSPKSLSTIPEVVIATRDRGFARADFQGIQIYFLFTANKVFEHVRKQQTRVVDIDGRPTPCATAQGLLILKLFALPSLYRQGENSRAAVYEADISYLLGTGEVDPERALGALTPHMLAVDIDSLRTTLADIPAKGARFKSGTQSPESKI